jgi:hypothetical protein
MTLVKYGPKKWINVNENQEGSFLTKSKFTNLIEESVRVNRHSYMDAVIGVCEQHGIALEEIKKFISPIIKDKIEAEARELNFLPKTNTLPIE